MQDVTELPSRMLRAAMVCVSDNDSRPALTAVHITPEVIEASNGHVAVRMQHGVQCEHNITVVFMGKIPGTAEVTHIRLTGNPVAEHYRKGVLVGATACQVLDTVWPSQAVDANIPAVTTQELVTVVTRYLAYPDKMFGTGAKRKSVGVAVCPGKSGGAVRFRFDKETDALFGHPVFIIMPCRYDGETGLE